MSDDSDDDDIFSCKAAKDISVTWADESVALNTKKSKTAKNKERRTSNESNNDGDDKTAVIDDEEVDLEFEILNSRKRKRMIANSSRRRSDGISSSTTSSSMTSPARRSTSLRRGGGGDGGLSGGEDDHDESSESDIDENASSSARRKRRRRQQQGVSRDDVKRNLLLEKRKREEQNRKKAMADDGSTAGAADGVVDLDDDDNDNDDSGRHGSSGGAAAVGRGLRRIANTAEERAMLESMKPHALMQPFNKLVEEAERKRAERRRKNQEELDAMQVPEAPVMEDEFSVERDISSDTAAGTGAVHAFDEDKAAAAESSKKGNKITIQARHSPTEEPISVMIHENDKFTKLLKGLGKHLGVNPDQISLLFDGDKVDPDETPAGLELEDGDILDVKIK